MTNHLYEAIDFSNIGFSRAETCMVTEPNHSNIFGNVHGGELMKLMDNIAGIAAAKHAKGMVVTARVDELEFHRAVKIGELVTCVGQLAYVGNASMQVLVTVSVLDVHSSKEPEVALTAFFTMVHLENQKPAKVEALVPKNKAEEFLFNLGKQKYEEIKQKKLNNVKK